MRHGGGVEGEDGTSVQELLGREDAYSLTPELVGLQLWDAYKKEEEIVSTWLGEPLNVERKKRSLADATRECNMRTVRDCLGFAVRCRGAPATLATLLDGDVLLGYVRFLERRGCKASTRVKALCHLSNVLTVLESPTGRRLVTPTLTDAEVGSTHLRPISVILAECASDIMLTRLLRAKWAHGLSTPVAVHSVSRHTSAPATCSAGQLAHPLGCTCIWFLRDNLHLSAGGHHTRAARAGDGAGEPAEWRAEACGGDSSAVGGRGPLAERGAHDAAGGGDAARACCTRFRAAPAERQPAQPACGQSRQACERRVYGVAYDAVTDTEASLFIHPGHEGRARGVPAEQWPVLLGDGL